MAKLRLGWRRWRYPIAIWVLIGLELPLTVAVLALFGIAEPDTYRTKLWRDGADNGFNSSPSAPLYAAANYQPSYIPLVWSEFLTKFNLTISVLSTFILLVKVALLPLNVMFPAVSLLIHGLELGLYSYSTYGQTSPDMLDPKRPNPGPPWYITKSCNVAALKSNIGYCQQAKASFIVTVFMLTVFAAHVILSIHSILFSPPKKVIFDDDSDVYNDEKGKAPISQRQQWEMMRIPDTPASVGGLKSPMTPGTRAYQKAYQAWVSEEPQAHGALRSPGLPPPPLRSPGLPPPPLRSPITPRTQAFHSLGGEGGGLPLRQHFPPPPKKAVKEKGRFF